MKNSEEGQTLQSYLSDLNMDAHAIIEYIDILAIQHMPPRHLLLLIKEMKKKGLSRREIRIAATNEKIIRIKLLIPPPGCLVTL